MCRVNWQKNKKVMTVKIERESHNSSYFKDWRVMELKNKERKGDKANKNKT